MNTMTTLLQVAAVFVLLFIFAWSMKKYGNKYRGGALLTVAARTPLTQRASAAVVTVAGESFLLGVSDGNVSLLARLDHDRVTQELAAPVAEGPATAGPSAAASAEATTASFAQLLSTHTHATTVTGAARQVVTAALAARRARTASQQAPQQAPQQVLGAPTTPTPEAPAKTGTAVEAPAAAPERAVAPTARPQAPVKAPVKVPVKAPVKPAKVRR